MISYSKDEFETMQQEAIRRVKEMKKKASSYINSSTFNSDNSTKANTSSSKSNNYVPPNNNTTNKNANVRNNCNPFSQIFGSNLGGFNRYKNNSNPSPAQKSTAAPSTKNDAGFNFLSNIPIDEEKLLILLLIYILYKNGADIKLIIALAYLII